MDLSSVVKNQLIDWKIGKQDGIVIGVSGGVDSIVLLHALHSKSQKIHAVHINYHLRGEESNLDQKHVSDFCKEKEIPLSTFDADPLDFKTNLQEKARQFRYQRFHETLKVTGFKYVATAHHLNDSIETFLINFSRGAGLKGLTGIKGFQNNIIRPMIHLSREEILTYAQDKNLSWREDQSNASHKYVRNKIRHEVVPFLENLEVRSKKAIQLSLSNLEKDYALLAESIQFISRNWTYENDGFIFIDLLEWNHYEQKETLLFHLLEKYGHFNIPQICDAIKTQPGKKFSSGDYHLWLDRDQLILQKKDEITFDEKVLIDRGVKEIRFPVAIEFRERDPEDFQRAQFAHHFAWLDFDKLTFPLTIRKWQYGDKFQPLGMKGKKKISDYLIDQKIPLPVKDKTLVLESNDQIVWLIGHRVDERFKVENESKKIYLARLLE